MPNSKPPNWATAPWWYYGVCGSGVLLVCAFVKFLVALPDLLTDAPPWDELLLLPLQVAALGFFCGVAVWAARPLATKLGPVGDALLGLIAVDLLFLSCMFIFDRPMLLERPHEAAIMFAFGAVVGLYSGWLSGRDLRRYFAEADSKILAPGKDEPPLS